MVSQETQTVDDSPHRGGTRSRLKLMEEKGEQAKAIQQKKKEALIEIPYVPHSATGSGSERASASLSSNTVQTVPHSFPILGSRQR